MKTIITHLLAAYLGAGLLLAVVLGSGIPALNAVGKAYIAVTWPAQIYCSSNDCAVPEWGIPYFFTFKDDR